MMKKHSASYSLHRIGLVLVFLAALFGFVSLVSGNRSFSPSALAAPEAYSGATANSIEAASAAVCSVYTAADVPRRIPSAGTRGTTTSTITVPTTQTIRDINVLDLEGTHTWIGDLSMALIAPSGTRVQLLQNVCGNADNFNLDFDDEAASATLPCPPTTGAAYQPVGSLADFDGTDAFGTWTLEIVDSATGDTGNLTNWRLEICGGPDIELVPGSLSSEQSTNQTTVQNVSIQNVGQEDLVWTLNEALATGASLSSQAAPAIDKLQPAALFDAAAISSLQRETGATVQMNDATGTAEFVQFHQPVELRSAQGTASAEAQADAFFTEYGAIFGVETPAKELRLIKSEQDQYGFTHQTYAQVYEGVAVFGGELRVHTNKANQITAVNGVFIPDLSLNPSPNLSPARAGELALLAVVDQPYSDLKTSETADLQLTPDDLEIYQSELTIYRTGLLRNVAGMNYLAYQIEVRSGSFLREFLFMDAQTGKLLDRYSAIDSALFRRLYESNTGNQIWQETNPFPGSLDQWQQSEIVSAGHVYYLFHNTFGRTSYNGADAEMRTVNNDPSISCPNANWNGSTANYCTGTASDDVVAHEWGHAYTEYTSNLIYAWQTGALNESYSDIWGETVDLINGYADADDDVSLRTGCNSSDRWRMGEDASAFGGAIRDMWDPTCNNDPGKVTDTQYVCTSTDSGGVHTNSGVPNHLYALLVDGGTSNGQTISALGLTKAAHLHWRAQSVYLTNTSDFGTHANALTASCTDLLGINLEGLSTTSTPAGPSGETITTADCAELAQAISAVELQAVACAGTFTPMLNPNAPAYCSASESVASIFLEDFESGIDGWTVSQIPTNPSTWDARDWTVVNSLPDNQSGSAIFGADPVVGDCVSDLDNGILRLESPVINIPGSAASPIRMAFDHYASLEQDWDGGNLKYKLNSGGWTLVPAAAFTFNGYNKTLTTAGAGNDNPLAGQTAFSGANGGSVAGSWGQSQLDLSVLGAAPGDTIQLRWEVGTDGCNGWDGWYVDDVELYSCQSACSNPADVAWVSVNPAAGTTAASGSSSVAVTFDSTGLSAGIYSANLCVDSNDVADPVSVVPVTLNVTDTCVAPSAVSPTISISGVNADDVTLNWATVANAASTNIYRSINDPYPIPGATYANTTTNSWSDNGAAGDPALNYFYMLRAQGCSESADSQWLGTFGFEIVPGVP